MTVDKSYIKTESRVDFQVRLMFYRAVYTDTKTCDFIVQLTLGRCINSNVH